MDTKFCGLASLLIRYLKAGDIFRCMYTTWDGSTNRVILKTTKAQNYVRFTLICHIFYLLAQIVSTIKHSMTVADTVEAVVLVNVCLVCFCCRFEFTADPLTGQLLDYFIHWPGNYMKVFITS